MGDPEDPSYSGSSHDLNSITMNNTALLSQLDTVPGSIDRVNDGGPTVGLNLNDRVLPRTCGAP